MQGYTRFFAMIITSTVIMYALMYANSYAWEHLYFSETRTYMALYMGAMMAVVMLSFMLGMYSNSKANAAIYIGSAVLFAAALYLLRSQEPVQDKSWMRAMIPHHSIAILTSERAEITDPRVKKLANEIVHAQNREIAEMRYLIEDIQKNGEVGDDYPLGSTDEPAPIETLEVALRTPEIAAIRPAVLSRDEIARALPEEADCTFIRAVNADPVLATAGRKAVVKISGSLVMLDATDNGVAYEAEGVGIAIAPGDGNGEGADMVFELRTEPPLRVGFDGYWSCKAGA